MSFLDIFKTEKKVINLDTMTDAERVKFFAEQAKKEEKLVKQIKSFVNQVIGLAKLLLPDEIGVIINRLKPYIEAFLTDPEKIADTMAETIEGICTKAGIPSHHLKVCITKPKGIVLESGEKVRNHDVRIELQIFNPNFKQWQSVDWDIRKQLLALKKKEIYDITGLIKEIYNAVPAVQSETAALDHTDENLKLSE